MPEIRRKSTRIPRGGGDDVARPAGRSLRCSGIGIGAGTGQLGEEGPPRPRRRAGLGRPAMCWNRT